MKTTIFLLLLAFSACSHLTVTPTPVATHEVSSWAKTNIIDADATGLVVTADFVMVYHELLKNYGKKLPVSSRPHTPDDGVTNAGANYHVTYEVQDRFADLKYFERNSGP